MNVYFDDFEFDLDRFELRRGGAPVALEPQVFDVLAYLIEHRDRLVPKEELLDEVWGDRFVGESALTSRIKAVRQALGDDGTSQRFVQTVRGRGYRFVAEVVSVGGVDGPTTEPRTTDQSRRDGDSELPLGTATFLFTDMAGSTRLWEQHPVEMRAASAHHDELVRSAIEANNGFVFSSAGNSFAAAFSRAGDAVEAAVGMQQAIGGEAWPPVCPIRIRVGLHAGEAHERNRAYFGPAVNKAARIMAGGHGGQILASSAVAAVFESGDLIDLGEHRLKDLTAGAHIYQIGVESFPPLRTLEAVRHNLPVERTSLVGRQSEIAQVAGLLRDHRLVTLLGIGGTGKTRLATAVAADQADKYVDGVWFVDLVPVTTSDQVAEAIASAAGLQLNESAPVVALAGLMSDRQMLVVLDNCEHITDQVADVVDVLLERTVTARWLTTSREPLQLPDERQVHVSPLEVDDDVAAPAVQLFIAAAERVSATVGSDDVATVVGVCKDLDGLPLSIELAAAQLRHLSLDELAARLDQRFEILARGNGGRMRRQASLQAVLEDTWAMLSNREQELLLQLAAFPSGFAVDDVEAICAWSDVGVPAVTLAGIVDRSLIVSDGHGRHRLLETVKLSARQRWATMPDPGVYFERHTKWVLGQLDSYESQDWYNSFELLGWAKAHYDDHRAVEDRLTKSERTGELAALLHALIETYCYETGTRASAVIERIDRLLEQLELSNRERGLLNLVAATAGLPARRPDWIERGSSEAVLLLRADGTEEELAAALIVGSWMTVFHDFDRAVGMLEEARATAERVGASIIADVALAYLAGHHALAGQIDESLDILGTLRTRLGNRPLDYAGSLYSLFTLAVHVVVDAEQARKVAEELSVGFADVVGDGGMGWGLPICLCAAVAACGDVEATRRLTAEAEAMIALSTNDDGLPDLLLPPAALAWKLGNLDDARRWLTAVRRSPKPTQNFQLTIIYRQLRSQVGLLDVNPLESAELGDIYAEAVAWMDSLVPAGDSSQGFKVRD